MIPNSLRLLIWLQFRASVRQIVRGLKSPKGVVIGAIFVLGAIGMMMPLFMSLMTPRLSGMETISQFTDLVPVLLFAYLLIILFSSLGTDALSFSPEEVENLFTAPYSRRQLLCYKLISTVRNVTFSTFFMSMGLAIVFPNLACALIGTFLTMMFAALMPILVTLLSQIGSQHLFDRKRKIVGIILAAALVFAIGQAANQSITASFELADLHKMIVGASETTVGKIVLAPTTLFADTIFSERIDGTFFRNAGIATGINILLFVIILRLDANYLGVVERTSKRLAELSKNLRSSGGMAAATRKEYSRSFPMLPFWFGMGPLIWRQFLVTLRHAKWLIVLALLVTGLIAIPVLMNNQPKDNGDPTLPIIALAGIGYMTFFFSVGAPIGFRPDIHRMEVFKCLPMGNAAIALGQLLGAIGILTLVQLFIVVLFAVFSIDWLWLWAIGLIAVLPVNYIALSISNIISLLLPVKTVSGPKDYAAIGQGLLSSFALISVTTIIMGVLFGCSAICFFFTSSWVATVACGLTVASLFCAVLSYLLVLAYRRFDVSLHTPV